MYNIKTYNIYLNEMYKPTKADRLERTKQFLKKQIDEINDTYSIILYQSIISYLNSYPYITDQSEVKIHNLALMDLLKGYEVLFKESIEDGKKNSTLGMAIQNSFPIIMEFN